MVKEDRRYGTCMFPLSFRGRLKHSRHFTFKSFTGDSAVTFVSEGVEGSIVNADKPLSAHGPWLQVWVNPQHTDKVLADIEASLAKQTVSYDYSGTIL